MTAATHSWVWHFDAPPARMWSIFADTPHFNEAAGFPRYRVEEQVQSDGRVEFFGYGKIGPFDLAWRELPFEWVAADGFNSARLFREGPFRSLRASMSFAPDGAGCRAEYRLVVEPASWLGRLVLASGFFSKFGKTLARLRDQAAAHAAGKTAQPFALPVPRLAPEVSSRITTLLTQLRAAGQPGALVDGLGRLVRTASDQDLARIRPLQLARTWQAGERETIELCLWAVKVGLLETRWELLCPNCRGAKLSVSSLDTLPRGAHCPSCNIDYARDFARNVELTFRPARALRPSADGEFCLLGPVKTPHVLVQQNLAPQEARAVAIALAPGDYRLRALHPAGEVVIDWAGGGFPAVVAAPEGMRAGPPATPGTVRFENRLDREITLLVESRAWVRDALTAHRVTLMQAFRDLFATEVLRAGDEVGIASITLMFTDLRGSTALYGRIGDAKAYHLVREHFAFLAETVRRHDGAVVKTIGDAVMAAFGTPAQAVRAALDVQRNVAAFNARLGALAGDGLVIKMGLHGGPCIAVNLNDRLDYFGSVVNMAARLQGESRGGDIVISAELADDPEVRPLLAGVPAAREQASIKGFDSPVAFLRMTPTGPAEALEIATPT